LGVGAHRTTGAYELDTCTSYGCGCDWLRLARSASGRTPSPPAAAISSNSPSRAAASISRGVDGADAGSSAAVCTQELAKLDRESMARGGGSGRDSGAPGAFAFHAFQLIHGQLKATTASRETLSARRHPRGSAVMHITRSARLELGAPSRGTPCRFRLPSVNPAMGALMAASGGKLMTETVAPKPAKQW